jgi:hypothetical protein
MTAITCVSTSDESALAASSKLYDWMGLQAPPLSLQPAVGRLDGGDADQDAACIRSPSAMRP